MRITQPATALVLALCCFLAPSVFAADSPDPAAPADMPPLSEGGEAPGNGDTAEPADQLELSGGGEEPEGGGAAPLAGEADAAGEEMETLSPEDLDLEMTVYYDERTGADYVEIRTSEKIEEYHYLSHIRYSDLIFVLSDLLRRITRDGYRWASAPEISYEQNEEVALLYRKDLVNDTVHGIVQFPDFKVSLSALREPDGEHRFNAENGRDMMTLVFSFAACLAQAEQTLGIKQLDYTMRFFKQE
jgi:hypothetical protein